MLSSRPLFGPTRSRRRRLALAALLVASLAAAPFPATADTPGPAPYTLRHDGTLSEAALDAPGTNLLVVGIDRRSDLTREQISKLHVGGQECDCTDVMMLVHLSDDGRRMSVVSLPRDSYVPYAPHDHPQHAGKINGAYKHGGPDLAVRTVEQATGLRVDHYLETDFARFADAVDALGGAQVCTDKPLEDRNSGLRLQPGTHVLQGVKALRYARARKVSPPGDLGRVRRQQRLLLGMLTRLAEAGALSDPVKLVDTASALLPHLRTDTGTGVATLFRLGWGLRELSADQLEFATVPMKAFDHRVPQWGSTLLWDEVRANRMFTAVREDRPVGEELTLRAVPVEMEPSTVPVRVDDPDVAEALRRSGFDVTKAEAPAVRPEGPTVITYDPYWERYASTLAAALPGAQLRPVEGNGHVFQVRVGGAGRSVVEVAYDRSMVEGAPVTGDQLRCK
ncbi:LytR family transcriptional regulator [Streptomyces spiroverticillatus]|uniref:LytR family transcriptional regulator n=1 Tax=Streptomyces finlayi TaxID=67296 RepID=A0A919CAJ9_9ACTN|nr:LCP family protein [Streptomyces finlayi]GHA15526.1 LytR family transcriptional regulator [Streptomyces spiroverticillatus]GHC96691.1 LytR family transcriptional regulator [Streptomyces finlayi]